MAAYDPKRPRPTTGDDEDPAPVEALLDAEQPEQPEPAQPEPAQPEPAEADAIGPGSEATGAEPVHGVPGDEGTIEVDLREPSLNGSGARVTSEVPVAAAPEEGTANRAVLIAGFSAAGLVTLLLVILLRRRRRID